jgi:hypothetical protein
MLNEGTVSLSADRDVWNEHHLTGALPVNLPQPSGFAKRMLLNSHSYRRTIEIDRGS